MERQIPKKYRGKCRKNVRLDYFVGQHTCRFCNTPIRNEKSYPLANFGQMFVELDGGGELSFNACTDCLRRLNLKDPQTRLEIEATTYAGWAAQGCPNNKIKLKIKKNPKKRILNVQELLGT